MGFDKGLDTWEWLAGRMNSNIAAVSWGPGRLDVFAVLSDGRVYHRWWDAGAGSSWSGWEDLGGGPFGSRVTAVSWGPGRLDVFAIGIDKAIHHNWFDRGWGGWESLGGVFQTHTAVSAVSWGPGRLDVFGLGEANPSPPFYPIPPCQVFHSWQDVGTGWSAWERLPSDTGLTEISAVCWGPNRIDLCAVIHGSPEMYHLAWDASTGWLAIDFGKNGIWSSLSWVPPSSGGWVGLTGTIAAVSPRPQRLDLFGLFAPSRMGAGTVVAHRSWEGAWSSGSWGDWELLGGDLWQQVYTLTAITWKPDRIDLFAVDVNSIDAHMGGHRISHMWGSIPASPHGPGGGGGGGGEVTILLLLNQAGANTDGILFYTGSFPGPIALSDSSVIERINVLPDLTYGSYTVSFLKPGYGVDDISKAEATVTITAGSSLTGDNLKSITGSATPKNVTVTVATSKILAVGDQLWLSITHT